MIRIGNIQNFFLMRINRQSSAAKSIVFPLELVHHPRKDKCLRHEDSQSDGDGDDPPSDRLLDHRSGESF
jgi:hypothetical protein